MTGGAGFLGRHIVDALTDTYDVRILDVRDSGDPSVETMIGDIRQISDVMAACKGKGCLQADHYSTAIQIRPELKAHTTGIF